MWIKVVPLNVSPNAPILAYPGAKPQNQSLVTMTLGKIFLTQSHSRQALENTANCYTVKEG